MGKKKCCRSTPRCKDCPLRKKEKDKKKHAAAVDGKKQPIFMATAATPAGQTGRAVSSASGQRG